MSTTKSRALAAMLLLPFATLALSQAHGQTLDSNLVNIDQLGSDNSGDIVQSGRNNNVGLVDLPFTQNGFFNDLSVLQTGFGNTVGRPGGILEQEGLFTTPSVFNRIEIEQTSNNNTIGSIEQRSIGSVPNGANLMILTQRTGDRNTIDAARQLQESGEVPNEMRVTQSGQDNRIVLASQTARTSSRGRSNIIRVVLAGNRNGRYALTGPAAIPLAQDSAIVQEGGTIDPRGNGNFVDLQITGDDNAFAIRQSGRLNTTGLLTIPGNQNDLGIRQDGDENDIAIGTIAGDGNSVGVDQLGTNRGEILLLGFSSENEVLLDQTGTADGFISIAGDQNDVTLRQTFNDGLGGDNDASVFFDGDGNIVAIEQRGTNTAELRVTGDGNNAVGLFSVVAEFGDPAAGVMVQVGADNDVVGEVTGDRNLFATQQLGSLNSILFVVSGDENEALLLQSGERNSIALRQLGTGNRAVIRQ